MAPDRLELVRGVYSGWGRGDFSTSLPLLGEDFEFIVDPEIPDSGTYEGRDGLRRYMLSFLASWEELTITGESFTELGDTVLVAVRQRGIGLTSRVPVELRYFQLWTFTGAAVSRLEVILREERALEVAGRDYPSEPW